MNRLKSILIAGCIIFTSTQVMAAKDAGKCYPKKNDFPGSLLTQTSARWSLKRAADTGGANKSETMPVPTGNVIVEWDVQRTSCNSRCTGPVEYLQFQDSGVFRLPTAVVAGVRWKKDIGPGSSGGIYSGSASMLYVSAKEWKKVFVNKYLDCTP